MRPPVPPPAADTILMESTYGGRRHSDLDPIDELVSAVSGTLKKGGVVLIPSFAVGRTQNLLICLHRAMADGRLASVPIHVDSPMATEVTRIYQHYHDAHRFDQQEIEQICAKVDFVPTRADSKALNNRPGPRIIIAGSGMLTGGRILHHLRSHAGDERNLLLLPGYQAPGSRGGDLMDGRRRIKLHGAWLDVHMRVDRLTGLSAHADHDELVAWFGSGQSLPTTTYLVHGDEGPAEDLRRALEEHYATDAIVPMIGDVVELSGGSSRTTVPYQGADRMS